MSHPIFDASIPVFTRTLSALDACLDKAQAHADELKFDFNNLLSARLAPDMFSLGRQIQIACDFAKGVSARLANVEMPEYEDNEVTLADYKARIAKTIAFIQSIPAEKFEGAESREIVIFRKDTKREYIGLAYLHHAGMPNFYFHVTTAYNILRHNGVQIGKKDFIGTVA
ncbi:MAG TPA: DUF1993 domain-containing protein [Arenimonas sp.]|nr:DUF1993 domain-containing protein [Arenimonas sp.]